MCWQVKWQRALSVAPGKAAIVKSSADFFMMIADIDSGGDAYIDESSSEDNNVCIGAAFLIYLHCSWLVC